MRVAVLAPAGPDEVGLGLCEAFAANGCDVELLAPDDRWPAGIALHVLYGPMAPLGLLLRRLKELPERPSVGVWYTEPLPRPQPFWQLTTAVIARGIAGKVLHAGAAFLRAKPIAHLADRAGRLRACAEMRTLQQWHMLDLLAVFTQRHVQVFGAWGLPVALIPMGACSSFGHPMNLNRDIDVAFIGSTRDRRRGPIVARLAHQLAAAGIHLVIKDGSPEHGYVFGAERAELLNRTKILLSLMRQPWDDPIFRLLLAAPNGALVLSEPVNDSGPFVAGRDFVVAKWEEMIPVIRHYLQANEQRERIASAAYRLVTDELTMPAMAQLFLQAWQRRMSDAAPTALPSPLGAVQ